MAHADERATRACQGQNVTPRSAPDLPVPSLPDHFFLRTEPAASVLVCVRVLYCTLVVLSRSMDVESLACEQIICRSWALIPNTPACSQATRPSRRRRRCPSFCSPPPRQPCTSAARPPPPPPPGNTCDPSPGVRKLRAPNLLMFAFHQIVVGVTAACGSGRSSCMASRAPRAGRDKSLGRSLRVHVEGEL